MGCRCTRQRQIDDRKLLLELERQLHLGCGQDQVLVRVLELARHVLERAHQIGILEGRVEVLEQEQARAVPALDVRQHPLGIAEPRILGKRTGLAVVLAKADGFFL